MDYLDADAQKASPAQLSRTDAMLMGRHTYQVLSTAWSTRQGEFAETINAIQKHVMSSTLRSTQWNNSTILSGDVITEATELKQHDGEDLMIYGHGPLGQTLLEHGLLDEIRLSVHPLIVGTGTLYYRNAGKKTELELVGSEPLPSGVIVLTYRPAVGPHLGL
jgi:dihydrofolate reductase